MSLAKRRSSEILDEIQRGFETYRSAGTTRSTQLRRSLQELSVKALTENFTAKEVARAAAVTPKSVRNWYNSQKKIGLRRGAKRLRVLPEISAAHFNSVSTPNRVSEGARITLTSGVIIECALGELSKNLLLALSSLLVTR